MVKLQVGLSPGRSDGRAFPSIQSPELYSSFIDIFGHLTAKSIDLFDQMSFSQPADSRVT
jgi:hypothetical protein